MNNDDTNPNIPAAPHAPVPTAPATWPNPPASQQQMLSVPVRMDHLHLVPAGSNMQPQQAAPSQPALAPQAAPVAVTQNNQPSSSDNRSSGSLGWILAIIFGVILLLLFIPWVISSSVDQLHADRNTSTYKAAERQEKILTTLEANQKTVLENQVKIADKVDGARTDIAKLDAENDRRQKEILGAQADFRKAIGGDVRVVRKKVEANGTEIGAIKADTKLRDEQVQTTLDALKLELQERRRRAAAGGRTTVTMDRR